MQFLTAIIPLLAGITQPIKDYFSYKQQLSVKEQEFKIASLQSQIEIIKSNNQADSDQLSVRLNATSQSFKQNTFYFLCIPVLFTMLFPNKAKEMWQNFNIIPEMFQWLFMGVYSSIWGFPLVKGGYGAITSFIANKRDFKIEQIKAYNDQAFYDILKQKIFTNGLTVDQVNVINEALKARESN